jgi:hypothetical protein
VQSLFLKVALLRFIDTTMQPNVLETWTDGKPVRVYAGNAKCEWLLVAPPEANARISLQIVDMTIDVTPPQSAQEAAADDAGGSPLCPDDFLQIFDGPTPDRLAIRCFTTIPSMKTFSSVIYLSRFTCSPSLISGGRMCGALDDPSRNWPRNLTSTGSSVLIRFFSDALNSDVGFQIQFRLVLP